MIRIVILTLFLLAEFVVAAQISNGDFNQFETIHAKNHSYDLPIGWKEHQKNDACQLGEGSGFAHKYDLPDANGNALALHREYSSLTDAIFTSFSTPEDKENLRLVGRYKFSGSDIDITSDTLRIIVFSSEKPLVNIPNKFPENTSTLDITAPKAQFERFQLDIDKIQKSKYLMVVIQLISGSDDSYYWGQSNAVLDDFKLVLNTK